MTWDFVDNVVFWVFAGVGALMVWNQAIVWMSHWKQ